jgi:pimeloyl-ACP methyl ester carboxylesterase
VLLVLSGGPGQPGLFILDKFVDKALAAEKQTYRIVVFDQRGTGAGALNCESMQQQMGASDLYPPTAAAVRACAAKIGDRRQFYGTDDVVADIDALRRALGVDILDALTTDSIVDPTYKTVFDIPQALHAARNGAPGLLESFISSMHAGDAAPAYALDQGLHASALCADWRYPWGTSAAPLAGRGRALNRAVAKLPATALFPFDRRTASGNGFIRQCLPWAPTSPTPLDRRKITVPTLLVNGNHDLSTPLEWAKQELARTRHGKLVVVPGAGHSTQSRSVSDVSRNSVAAFLNG